MTEGSKQRLYLLEMFRSTTSAARLQPKGISQPLATTSSSSPSSNIYFKMHSTFHRYWRSLPKLTATPRTGLRFASTSFLLRVPSSNAPREVPTPLLFVSAGSWDKESTTGYFFLQRELGVILADRRA